jgi:CysZ protein
MSIVSDFSRGPGFLWQGFGLIRQPGLRSFVIIPLLINIAIIVGLTWLFGNQLDAWLAGWLGGLPDWLAWLETLLWWLGFLLALLLFCYFFTLLANLIASPFNGVLSARVEQHLTGRKPDNDNSLWAEMRIGVTTELRKLAYHLWRAVLLGLLSLVLLLIPGMAAVIPFLWFGFGAFMLALEYLDHPMANRGLPFKRKLQYLKSRRGLSLGFGSAVTLLTMIPLANLLVMPAAVAGATALWVREINREG